MKNTNLTFKRLSTAVFVCFFALMAQGVWANWSLDMVSGSVVQGEFMEGSYINGISTDAAVQIYLTTDEKALRGIYFLMERPANATWKSIEWEDVLQNDAGKPLSSLTAKQTLVKIEAGVSNTALAANSNRVLVGTLYYSIDEVKKDSLALSFVSIQSANTPGGDNYKTKVSVTGPSALSLLEAFNFSTIDENPFEMDEDGGDLVIDAADGDHFEASAWNGTAVVATTDVKFKEVGIKSQNDPGSVDLTAEGKIVFTPHENFYGEVVLSYKAVSTDASITSEVEDELTINVAPVMDIPVVTVKESNLQFKEGLAYGAEANTKTLVLSVVDVDDIGLDSEATLSCDIFTLDVSITPSNAAAGEYLVSFDGIMETLGFEVVTHPETSLTLDNCVLSVMPDLDSAQAIAVEGISVKLLDVDRPARVTSFTADLDKDATPPSYVDGKKIYADTVITYHVEAEDPDTEDTVTTSVSTDPDPAVQTKGNSFTATAYAQSDFSEELIPCEDYMVQHYTVVNSAPVANPTEYSLFIQKKEGKAGGSGQLTLTATDVDVADTELKLIVVSKPESGWSVSTSGDGQKCDVYFETKSAEELIDQIFTFKFYDGEAYSELITVTVNFRQDPPPVFGEFTTEGTPKEAEEEPWVVTTSVADSNTAVEPSGIKSVTWTLCDGEGKSLADYYTAVVEYSADGQTWSTTMPQIAGAATLYTRCSYLFDYDFIEHPAYKKDIKVIVTAVDGNGASQNASTDATVEDTDRAPTEPTNIIMLPLEPVFGSTITANANGSQDADGDDFTYVYVWFYSEDGGETYNRVGIADFLKDNTAVQRGNVVKVLAFAKTTPYGGESEHYSHEHTEEFITIGNTAPVISWIDGTPIPAEGEYSRPIGVFESQESFTTGIGGSDVDTSAPYMPDTLTWDLDKENWDDAAGTFENQGNNFKYTPAAHYFNNGENMPYVIVKLKDDTGTSAANWVKLSYLVGQINDKPVVKAEDQYVLPDERGKQQTATFEVNMGVNEDDQEVKYVEYVFIDDAYIFEESPTVSFEGKNVILTYKVKADAELGKSATITLKAQDNGQSYNFGSKGLKDDFKWSEEVTITVFVGASPWYPIISFECVEPESHVDGHTFHLVAGNDAYDLTVKGDTNTLMPADYAAAGVPGFQDNTDIDVTVYVWTMEDGTTETICAEKEVTVSEYGLPGAATCAEESVMADEDGWVTLPEISVPMAQRYLLSIRNAEGEEVQTLAGDFTPNDSGIILPVIADQTLQIAEAGGYTVVVKGINPNGEGEETEVLTITVPEDTEAVVEWTGDEFLPENGRILTTDAVKLSWPVATNAESYIVRVYGPDGKLLEEATDLFETNYTTTETIAEEKAQNYTWYVSAIRDGEVALASEFHNFTLATTTKDVIPDGVAAVGPNSLSISFQGILEEDAVVKVDCLYYSCATNKVTDNIGVVADTSTAGQLIVTLTNEVAENDYVVLYIYVNGELCGDGAGYMVQGGRLMP